MSRSPAARAILRVAGIGLAVPGLMACSLWACRAGAPLTAQPVAGETKPADAGEAPSEAASPLNGVFAGGSLAGEPLWPQAKLEEISVILPSGTQVVAELADEPLELQIGLMGRESLPAGHGMLLDKGTGRPMSIWMKNCLIPLDLVWIEDGGRIASVVEAAPPCAGEPCASYDPGVAARYVLELPAGTIRAEGLRPGGLVRIIRVGHGARS